MPGDTRISGDRLDALTSVDHLYALAATLRGRRKVTAHVWTTSGDVHVRVSAPTLTEVVVRVVIRGGEFVERDAGTVFGPVHELDATAPRILWELW